MRRLNKIQLMLCLLALMEGMPLGYLQAQSSSTNFVLFLVDDFGWGALSSMGSRFHETPNIDRLLEQGVYFTSGYAASAVCSPSRAALLTGRYPARLHLTDWVAGHQRPTAQLSVPDWRMYIEHQRVTVAEALKEHGYQTGFFGKWHLIPYMDADRKDLHGPESHGFDLNVGGCEWGQPKGPGKYFYPWAMPNLEGKPGDYLTDRLTDYAADFLRQNQNNPFLLYFSYYTVHSPFIAKPELVDKYTRKQRTGDFEAFDPTYAAMVESLDQSVGRITETLEVLGLDKNTVIIFTADNGAVSTLHCGGLKGSKAFSYEGGTREPLIIKGPGIEPAICEIPVIGMDLYPTMLELAGLPSQPEEHVDGVSLVPLLSAGGAISERSLFWHYPHYHKTYPYGAVRRGDWKLIEFFEDQSVELYNLIHDPSEQRNLAEKQPVRAQALLSELEAWRVEVGAQLMLPNPERLKPLDEIALNTLKVTASSSQPGNEPRGAFDYDSSSRWAAADWSFPQSLSVTYTEPRAASAVQVEFWRDTVTRYTIEVQNSLGRWSMLTDQRMNAKKQKVWTHPVSESVTAIRINVLGAKKGWASISDIRLLTSL